MNIELTNEQLEVLSKGLLKGVDYTFEKNKLKAHIGEDSYATLKEAKAIIAGGMITSLFTNKPINDVDIYFRTYENLYSFAEYDIQGAFIISHTKKATQYVNKDNGRDVIMQLIHYREYQNVEEIFNTFDYTVCMGAFDFETEEFVLHSDFLKHNSQRILRFNSGTSYPLISAIRVQKYEDKGYTISKAEFMRVIMTCMKLEINSYDELKEHLGGMYGESYDRLFEDIKDEEFDLTEAIERIADFTKSDTYFKEFKPVEIPYDEVLDDLDKGERFVVELKKGKYRVINNKVVGKYQSDKPYTLLDVNEFYKGKTFYKCVKKTENGLYSFYKNDFEYKIGEVVSAKDENAHGRSDQLFFIRKENIKHASYFNNKDATIIELEVIGDDMVEDSAFESTATKVKVLRELSKEEQLSIRGESKEELIVDVSALNFFDESPF